MKSKYAVLAGLLTIPAFFLASSVQASPITGTANIFGDVSVSGTSIAFSPSVATAGGLETGDFSGVTSGTIRSLTSGPATGNTYVPGFLTFSAGAGGPIIFDLTYIAPGVGTLADCSSSALGAECTPAGSPFTLIQLPSNTVVVGLQLNGRFYSGSVASGVTNGVSIFNTQSVLFGTIPGIVAMLDAGQSLSGVTYSASFEATPAVPEPSSVLLLGIGLAGAGVLARYKRNR